MRAEVDEDAWREAAELIPEEPAERVRAVVGRVVHALGLRATVDIEETDEEIRATVNGDELGLLIGKHGSTIDAVQHLAFRAAFAGREGAQAGDRGRGRLPRAPRDGAAPDGGPGRRRGAALRPRRRARADARAERKIVHTYLSERTDVETHCEGDEPDRRLVISPAQAFREPERRGGLRRSVSRETSGSRGGRAVRLVLEPWREPDPHTTVSEPAAAMDRTWRTA